MIANSELLSNHPKTVKLLKDFTSESLVPFVAGLHLIPEIHANSLRIKALGAIAAVSCLGTKAATVKDFERIIKTFDTEFAFSHLEDPPEDVFTAYISTNVGGWIVFTGNTAHGYFWLERLILFLSDKGDFPGSSEILASVIRLQKKRLFPVIFLEGAARLKKWRSRNQAC
ncbi:MAG: hypothetical protein P1V19_23700 [Gimesia sp.]|nr:hypothetical protein [Gimesia sp.]